MKNTTILILLPGITFLSYQEKTDLHLQTETGRKPKLKNESQAMIQGGMAYMLLSGSDCSSSNQPTVAREPLALISIPILATDDGITPFMGSISPERIK